MKKLILPLLILLTCSICYGKSLRIGAMDYGGEYTISFLDSTDEIDGKIDFFVRDLKIDLSKHEKEYKMLILMLNKHFSKKFDEMLKFSKISKNAVINYYTIEDVIMRLAVVNNYQVTFKESLTNPVYSYEIFMYKADN